MDSLATLSRRSFLAASAALPAVFAAGKNVPIGIELYSVRNELAQDLDGTVKAVAKLGYEGVEFFSPYMQWDAAKAKEVRKLLDDLNIRCFSTHNSGNVFTAENIGKAIELNQILGSKFIIMASAGRVQGLDGWKGVAQRLNEGAAKMKPAGLRAGFHNHQLEFMPIEGTKPMEVLARETDKSVTLQLDVGTCMQAGADPVAWINANPGRITSLHLKEWSPEPGVGYKALLGEGKTPWMEIFAAAEKTGGVEYYLVEQEGSRYSPMETAERCLNTLRKMRS